MEAHPSDTIAIEKGVQNSRLFKELEAVRAQLLDLDGQNKPNVCATTL